MEKVIIPTPRRLVGLIDNKRDDLSREAFIKICIDHTLAGKSHHHISAEEEYWEKKEKELPWQNTFNRAWLVAFLSYGIGDVAASYMSLNRAGFFEDPLMRFLFDNNFYPVIPFKITVLLSVLLISYLLLEKRLTSLLFPVLLSIAGIFFIIGNILHSIGI